MKRFALLALVLLAAGCGGSEEGSPAGGTGTGISGRPAGTVTTEPTPQKDLPAPVQETREAIIAAAQTHDYGALAGLIPETGFTYSYGGPAEGGAPGYWQDLEAGGERPLETMVGLLALRHTRVADIYIWPYAYDRNPANLTNEQKDALAAAGAATREQLDQMADFGHYLGWRLGIRRDGTWIFFVAGD